MSAHVLTTEDLEPLRRELAELRALVAGRVHRAVLSRRSAARMLGVGRGKALPGLIAAGHLREVEIAPGRLGIPREDVERLIAEGIPTPATPARRRPGGKGDAASLRSTRLDDL